MQALRHASCRALRASVMQDTFAVSVKAYSVEAASTGAARKTKEERYELARQFVAKFKAANNGQFPGITLLRKEVGGKYETLKEVLQELSKGQDEPDTPKQTVELKDAEEKAQEFAATAEDGILKKSPLKEGSKKEKKEMQQSLKGSKAVKAVDPAQSRTISKDIQSVKPVKNTSKLVKDTILLTDDDDDSDVAAPEYHGSALLRKANHKVEEGVKAAKIKEKVLENGTYSHLKNMNKEIDGQAMKSKHVDMKQPVVQDGGIRIDLLHKAQGFPSAGVKSLDDTAANCQSTDGSFGFGSKAYTPGPLTTVARIVNLPQHITASKLKAICGTVGRVHDVELRRGLIADVHFDVPLEEMNNILARLKKLTIGTIKLRVFLANRFACGNDANSHSKPQDAHHYRQVRNILFGSLEQRLKFLTWQLQDFRELQELKADK